MHRKTLFRALFVMLLGLSVVGTTLAVPAVGHAGEADEARALVLEGFGPHTRAAKASSSGWRSSHVLLRQLRELDLDESQKERIRDIVQAAREDGQSLREELRESMISVRDLVEDEGTAEAALTQAVEAVLSARQALGEHRRAVKEQVREILTPRQQAQLVLMIERGRKGPRGGPGHPGRRGPGPR